MKITCFLHMQKYHHIVAFDVERIFLWTSEHLVEIDLPCFDSMKVLVSREIKTKHTVQDAIYIVSFGLA